MPKNQYNKGMVLSEYILNKTASLKGGMAEKAGKKPSDFDPKQLRKGMGVEKEHTPDPALQRQIAMDHLTEFPNYYEALSRLEKVLKAKKNEDHKSEKPLTANEKDAIDDIPQTLDFR